MAYDPFDGPIPGENYTTDTRNFPWFRPPEYTDFDKCIEVIYERLFDDETSGNFLTMIEIGYTIKDVSQMIVMSGIMNGMWSIDFAILLAGPVAHMLVIMCRGADLEYELGIEQTTTPPSASYFRALAKTAEELKDTGEGEEQNVAPEAPAMPEAPVEPQPGLGAPSEPASPPQGLGAPSTPVIDENTMTISMENA